MAYGEHRKNLVKKLKAGLTQEGAPKINVRGGRGRGGNWIDVTGSGEGGKFTPGEKEAIKRVCGAFPESNFWCSEVEQVGKILGIPNYWE